MNYYLIDYENIADGLGFRGTQYLCQEDCIILFYSKAAHNMRSDIWDEIEKSGCQIKLYKLIATRGNALDFYIACEAAILFERGEQNIAIITKDKDLTSVVDFLRLKAGDSACRIYKTPTLEEAMTKFDNPPGFNRKKLIMKATQPRNFDNIRTAMEKKNEIHSKIHETLGETLADDEVIHLQDLLLANQDQSLAFFYNRIRHEFGNDKGLLIYRSIRQVLKELGTTRCEAS